MSEQEHLTAHPSDPRYLSLGGKTWIPIGLNTAFVRAWTDPAEALVRHCVWIDRIADNGGNCARIWLSQPLLDPETKRAGEFDPKAARRLHVLLDRARERDVKLKLCIDHVRSIFPRKENELFPGAATFHKPVWAKAAGGPADTIAEYIDGKAGREHYLKRVDFFADITGNDTAVMGWELWNEVNCVEGDWVAWTKYMLPEVARRVSQPVMQSYGGDDYEGGAETYQKGIPIPGNAMAQIHRYINMGSRRSETARGPMDIMAGDAIHTVRALCGGDRPLLLNECSAVEPHYVAPSHLLARDKKGTLLHDLLFAPFFAGAAGSGMSWYWDHHYFDLHNLWWHLKRFANAVKDIDPVAEKFQPERRDIPGIRVWQLSGPRMVTAWLRDAESDWKYELEDGENPRTVSDARWKPGFSAEQLSNAKIEAYDPWADTWQTLRADGDEIIIPAFKRSLVVRARLDL
ncbi:MAG: hypothetical protein AABZ39_15605 [Spirochaetota bacterium]